jgi:uncharacterized GH25 family protein
MHPRGPGIPGGPDVGRRRVTQCILVGRTSSKRRNAGEQESRRMKKLLTFLTLFGLAQAHEFWLEPTQFRLNPQDKLRVDIRVGMQFDGIFWSGGPDRLVKLQHYWGANSAEDARESVSAEHPQYAEVELVQPGEHLLAFHNKNTFIAIEGPEFDNYLKTEGLDHILKLRQGKEQLEGREWYQRCVKTLVGVGPRPDKAPVYNRVAGLPLELVADSDPYAQPAPSKLAFRVLFQGKPLANNLIQVWNKGRGVVQKVRSDSAGRVEFDFQPQGTWMVSTVHMEPVPAGQEADWQSYWGSYTFGF